MPNRDTVVVSLPSAHSACSICLNKHTTLPSQIFDIDSSKFISSLLDAAQESQMANSVSLSKVTTLKRDKGRTRYSLNTRNTVLGDKFQKKIIHEFFIPSNTSAWSRISFSGSESATRPEHPLKCSQIAYVSHSPC